MILWGKPLWLIGLILPVLMILVEWMLRKSRQQTRENFASSHLWQVLVPGRSNTLRRVKIISVHMALILLIIALADPQVGTKYEEVTREGVDIFLLVDVSRSMDTRDIRPSRIDKTRYELNKFIQGLKGDRIGIIPFAGSAYTLSPLTLDYGAAAVFVDLLETGLIPNQGTAMADAISTALESFKVVNRDDERGRAIILVSDGEDHEGGVIDVARESGKQKIPIYTIGMALAKGDPVPEMDEAGNSTGWKTDKEGHVVTSSLNESLLRDIAQESGGKYWRASQGGEAFNAAYRNIFGLERTEMSQKQITGYEHRFQAFLILSFILLLVDFALPWGLSVSKRVKKMLPTAIVLIAILPVNLLAASPHALVKEGNKQVIESELDSALTSYFEAASELDTLLPELLYNLGGVYSRMGEVGKADTLFRSLPEESDPKLRARAAYNHGTTMAQNQQYDQAVKSFIEALRLDSKDMDAKNNLELALQMLQQQEQQQEQQQDQQQNDDQQQDQENEQQQEEQQQEQQQQEQEQQQPKDQQQQQEQQEQEQQRQAEEMDRKLAEQLLDKLQRDEKEQLKEIVRQQIPVEKNKKKDW